MALIRCEECGERISDRAVMCPHCGAPRRPTALFGYEYRSEATMFGLPLVHVAFGYDPFSGRPRIAVGVIAVGNIAVGLAALGGVVFGVLAFGGVAIGLAAFGGVGVGVLLAMGGAAIGAVAIGGAAAGYYAAGGAAAGVHTISAAAQDPAAIQFFERLLPGLGEALRSSP